MANNVLLFLLTCTIVADKINGEKIPKFSAILVFGDSSVDTGNNNYIITPVKGDHLPYGLDFPGRVPTGRFSNGKLVPDIVASMLGLKEAVPPFLQPFLSDKDLLTGVSFASAGSGYDELTTAVTRVIPVSKQIGYLKVYIQRLKGIIGEKEVPRFLSKALVVISAGTNDFIFNFYDIPTRRIQFCISKYQDFLQNKLQYMVKVRTAFLPPCLSFISCYYIRYPNSKIIMQFATEYIFYAYNELRIIFSCYVNMKMVTGAL